MMKKAFVQIMMFFLLIQAAFAESVVINQVLYDPAGSESGSEAIELYNPTESAINLSGWVIATETSATDVTLPDAVIEAGGYYLIADVRWDSQKDDSSWPHADHEEIMTLANSDSGIAIRNSTAIVDAVGWGQQRGIESGLYEGTPHSGAASGEALVRTNGTDTGNNSQDFTAAVPDFHAGTSSVPVSGSGGQITVVAVVEGSSLLINSFSILTDDEDSPGIQVHPIPKKDKTVEVVSIVTHLNGNAFIESVELSVDGRQISMTKESDVNGTSSVYEASFEMKFYDEPGEYKINLTVTDKSGVTINSSLDFEYLTSIALEIDTSSLEFRAMPGKSSEISGDSDESTGSNVTIINIGNSAVDVELSGTNLTGSDGVIDVSNIMYTFNGDYNNSMAGTLSSSEEIKRIGIPAAAKQPLSFRLDVPAATSPGNYTGTITLIAVGK